MQRKRQLEPTSSHELPHMAMDDVYYQAVLSGAILHTYTGNRVNTRNNTTVQVRLAIGFTD